MRQQLASTGFAGKKSTSTKTRIYSKDKKQSINQ